MGNRDFHKKEKKTPPSNITKLPLFSKIWLHKKNEIRLTARF